MNVPEPSRADTQHSLLVFFVFLALGLALVWYTLPDAPELSNEAVVRCGVGNDLLSGLSRGRQGLIGSLYWPPLPTLVALPFLRLPWRLGGEWAFVLTAACAAAMLATLLNTWLRRNGLSWGVSLAAALTVFLSPPLQRHVAAGSSDVLFALLGAAALCFLLNWLRTDHLRSLAYLAVALMLAIITRYQAVLLLAGAMVFVAVRLLARRRRKKYAEATLTVFLVPPLYAALLWAVANWVIMGEATFFLRGLGHIQFSRPGLAAFLREGCDWQLLALAGVAATVPWLVNFVTRRAAAVGAVPALAASFLFWVGGPLEQLPSPDPAQIELEQEVVSRLNTVHRADWIVVSGYRGYIVARSMPGQGRHRLQHVLSFYPEKVLKDTLGRRVYLLVPRPHGQDRWEDVNLKYPGIFERGTKFTVHEASWTYWRLLRIVRMDPTDRR